MTVISLAALWLAKSLLALGAAVLALLALALAILVLVLILPFRFSGRWSRPRASPEPDDGDGAEAPARWQLHVQWGGPLLQADLGSHGGGFQLRLLGRALSQRAKGGGRPGAGRSARAQRAPRRGSGGPPWREWLNRGVWEQGVLLLKRLWRSLHPELQGDLVLGLEDPSLTGMLAAARAVLPWSMAPDLQLTLDFSRPVLEGWVEARGHGNLAGMAWALLRALFSRPVRRVWTGQIRRSLRRMLRWRSRPSQGRQSRPVT